MTKRLLTPGVLLALTVTLAACGSSSAPGVEQAPSAGLTQASVPAPIKVPADLSTEPTIAKQAGTPPKTLVTKDLITGTGPMAAAGQTVTVNYVGELYKNGKVFDASWNRHQTFTTPLTASSPAGQGVIPGWVQGIQGMKVGGRRELIIPPNLAYGKTGQPPTIPPNSTLVFVVDLLGVQ
jgi:peptidylprolyl isomerase